MWNPLVLAHIPKTGGTSVRVAVEQAMPLERILRVYRAMTSRPEALTLLRGYAADGAPNGATLPDFISGHFGSDFVNAAGLRQARAFTVLRDPYERAVSLWRHEIRNYPHSLFGAQARELNLVEFFEARFSPVYENSQARLLVGCLEQETQWKLTSDDHNLLERAKAKMQSAFSFVGFTDDLTSTFAWIGAELGVALESVRTNVDGEPKDTLLNDPAHRKVIERFFGTDIALYNWARRNCRDQ